MLLLTCVVCGGIPALAFAYINGKIKFSNHGKTPSEKQKRAVFRWLAFLLGSFMGCFLFPTYNFTKTYPNDSHWYSVYLSVMWCLIMGAFLSQAFPYKKGCLLKTTPMLMAFNSLYILAGMGCRYLLEFGEVSNTYNFTVPNMIVHVLLINTVRIEFCVLGSDTTSSPLIRFTCLFTVSLRFSTSRSVQRSASSSPLRRPLVNSRKNIS